jgi:hypothetical protein
MRGHLTQIERRWRTIASSPKASIKLRLAALGKMQNASDRFLSGFLRACNHATLEFAANEMREFTAYLSPVAELASCLQTLYEIIQK